METKVNTKQFYNAKDVAERMQISLSMAYKLIRRMNAELTKKGYIVVSGKISRIYFESRVYGAPAEG